MRRRSLTSTFVRRLASTFTRLHNSVATITSKISSTIEAAAGPALGTIKRRARTAGPTRLRIWGSGVRISPGAAIFLGVDGKLAGVIAVADSVKATTQDALNALVASGIRVVMLTGDNRTTAQAVAKSLGITEVESEVLPSQKSAVIEKLRAEGRVVAMAGDGVNDAPALAAAEVGIAMGTGTDVAIESAGITLLGGDLNGIVRARRLSQATMSNIRQNLFFAFFYNCLLYTS